MKCTCWNKKEELSGFVHLQKEKCCRVGWNVLPLKRLTVVCSGHSNLLPNAVCWPVKAMETSVVDKCLQLNTRSFCCFSSLTIENQWCCLAPQQFKLVILGVLLKVVLPTTTWALPPVHQAALVWAQSVISFCMVFSNKNTEVIITALFLFVCFCLKKLLFYMFCLIFSLLGEAVGKEFLKNRSGNFY